MTEFHVEVFKIGKVEKHPNADTLSITEAHGGYPVIFKTGDYVEGQLAVYVPVDAIVPNTPEWSWLAPGAELRDKDRRIKAKRLRKIFSMGLITDAPPNANVGDDVANAMGITQYDPDADAPRIKPKPPRNVSWWKFLFWWVRLWFGFGDQSRPVKPPRLAHTPGVYDIEPFRRYGRHWFNEGEFVVVTEKIHGQNASFVHDGKKLHIKSRTRWRRNDPAETGNTWAKVAKKYALAERLKAFPGVILYGETYGNNSDMPYGVDRARDGDAFLAFDAFDSNTGKWLDYREFAMLCDTIEIPCVPILCVLGWRSGIYEALFAFAEGPTMLGAKHVREGFVVRPMNERTINGGQRVILKMAGEGYLTRKTA